MQSEYELIGCLSFMKMYLHPFALDFVMCTLMGMNMCSNQSCRFAEHVALVGNDLLQVPLLLYAECHLSCRPSSPTAADAADSLLSLIGQASPAAHMDIADQDALAGLHMLADICNM